MSKTKEAIPRACCSTPLLRQHTTAGALKRCVVCGMLQECKNGCDGYSHRDNTKKRERTRQARRHQNSPITPDLSRDTGEQTESACNERRTSAHLDPVDLEFDRLARRILSAPPADYSSRRLCERASTFSAEATPSTRER